MSLKNRQQLNRLLMIGGRLPMPGLDAGLLVRSLRSYYRLSQRQLAQRSGVGQPNIAAIEAGRASPGVDTLRRLLQALCCDLVLVPRPRQRPGEALGQLADRRPDPWRRYLLKIMSSRLWNDSC